MEQRTDISTALRSNGHRVTQARLVVWQALAAEDAHLTAEQIAERVEAIDPGVNLASVYRSLTLFEEMGLVRQTHLGEQASHWERAHPDEHFHLVCRRCGAVDHHAGSLVAQVAEHLGDGHGYTVESIELIVTGLCPACSAR